VFGVAVCSESVEGVDCGESGVAGADAVVSLAFEVVEEAADHLGVEIGEVEACGALADLGVRVGE
jgi:hypothetical protein